MKKRLSDTERILFLAGVLLLIVCTAQVNAQTCGTGGCAAADTNSTGQYPAATFSTTTSSWSTVSAFMNAGNYTLFDVTSGEVYEWTYCSDFGGSEGWDAELTLFDNSTGVKLCYDNNCGRANCSTAPYIRWTATFTGTVKLLTTVSGCTTNTGSPYSTLVWRDTSATPLVPIIGVDVYSGNSTINWNQVKAAGYTFAYAKATEGVGYTDSEYLNYAVNGVSAGMKMGAYHFARADLNPTNAGAISEANYFLSVAQPYITACGLPPSLDLEGSYLETSFTSAQLTDWVQNWMNTVETATGIRPVLYIGASTVSFLNSSLNVYPLWRDELSGNPNTAPTNLGVWNSWAFNQYSWTSTVSGIAGSQTDVNVFNGDMTAFNNFMGCTNTGINLTDNLSAHSISIFPNPFSSSTTLQLNGNFKNATLTVYNSFGQIVKQIENISGQTVTLSRDNLPSGLYFIRIIEEKKIYTNKLVITD